MNYVVTIFRLITALFAILSTSRAWLYNEPANWAYFTYQTNLLIAIVFIWAGSSSFFHIEQPPAFIKGGLTLNIIITGLVAWLVLPPDNPNTLVFIAGIPTITMAHVIVPILATVDFLLFDTHKRFKWRYSFTWLLYFVFYLSFVLIRAKVFHAHGPQEDGSPYPYPFINLDRLGLSAFITNCIIYLTIFFVIALIVILADKVLPERNALSQNFHATHTPHNSKQRSEYKI